jgi:peptidoglycan/LPS O-acetylase OafA/YrhL
MAQKKLVKIEALRGFAAFYVVIFHIYISTTILKGHFFSIFLNFGQEAVIIFFILSGFVIHYSFTLSNDKSFKTYFLRRFNRIFIPLIIIFIANYILFYLEGFNVEFEAQTLIGNLLMLQDLGRVPRTVSEPFLHNNVLWSLHYEWWFYMVFFLVYWFFKEKNSNVVYALGVIASISYLFFPFWGNRLLIYMVIWNVGGDVAKIYMTNHKLVYPELKKPIFMLLVLLVILGLNIYLNTYVAHDLVHFTGNVGLNNVSPRIEFRHVLTCLIAVIAYIVWCKLNWFGFNATIGLFEWIAPFSYSLYISHLFMVTNAIYLSFIGNIYIEIVLYILICMLFSYVVEVVIYPRVNKFILTKFHPNDSKPLAA